MRGLKLWSIAATLMAVVSASAVFANPPPDLDDDEPEAPGENKGGNAIDKTTPAPASGQSGLSPRDYEIIGDFWGQFLQAGEPFSGALEVAHSDGFTIIDPPSLRLTTAPTDGPAESVLDQIDERLAPPVLVGMPGSEASSATGTAPAPTEASVPPPESILDFIDTTPAPPPAAGPTQEAAKPAVDQAPKPAVVKSPPP